MVFMTATKVKNIFSQQAWEILMENPQAVLLDVRTRMEYEYVGHAPNALNIPWVDFPYWQVDTNFVDKVCGECPQSATILAMCRSGKRSLAALEKLASNGFTVLYNIEDGFEGDLDENGHRNVINGWRVAGLPWLQS